VLVLSDVKLQTGDGFEIARHVRRESPGTPVILMTTHHTSNVLAQAAQIGAHYLRKPFSNAELISAIKTLLNAGA